MSRIELNPSDVPADFKAGYAGRRFAADIVNTGIFEIPENAGMWEEGSKDNYYKIENGVRGSVRAGETVVLHPGVVLVRKSVFQGKDMGLVFYVSPESVAKLLPKSAEPDITRSGWIVLIATRSLKSNYGGKDRYQLAKDEVSYCPDKDNFPTRDQWIVAEFELVGLGLRKPHGGLTVEGKNLSNKYSSLATFFRVKADEAVSA